MWKDFSKWQHLAQLHLTEQGLIWILFIPDYFFPQQRTRNYLEGDRDLSCCLSFPSGFLAGQEGLSFNPNDLQ